MTKNRFQIVVMLIFSTLATCCESSIPKDAKSAAKENPTKEIRIDTDLNCSSGISMVLIPCGKYTVRSEDPESNKSERPAYEVELDAFFMDATEVTNTQWGEFTSEVNYGVVQANVWPFLTTQVKRIWALDASKM